MIRGYSWYCIISQCYSTCVYPKWTNTGAVKPFELRGEQCVGVAPWGPWMLQGKVVHRLHEVLWEPKHTSSICSTYRMSMNFTSCASHFLFWSVCCQTLPLQTPMPLLIRTDFQRHWNCLALQRTWKFIHGHSKAWRKKLLNFVLHRSRTLKTYHISSILTPCLLSSSKKYKNKLKMIYHLKDLEGIITDL